MVQPSLRRLTDAGVACVLIFELDGCVVRGRVFRCVMYTNAVLSGRLGRSDKNTSPVSKKSRSSSLTWLACPRWVDVIVRERWTRIPLSYEASGSRTGGVLAGRPPKQERLRAFSRQRVGTSKSASFSREDAVVPKTTNMKMPGVVPGMSRNRVWTARAVLRFGADSCAS